ncbi:MAG TPA: hypothetical protein VKX49_03710 [Bryobacteraceae bacterium]|nr:hypothetical protein [Bryobacteraceae bacterium]
MKVVAGFHSALADPIRTFVEYKRALNRKYRPESAALRLFDRYLCEHGATGWKSIDSVLIEGSYSRDHDPGHVVTTISLACCIGSLSGPCCRVSSQAIL